MLVCITPNYLVSQPQIYLRLYDDDIVFQFYREKFVCL